MKHCRTFQHPRSQAGRELLWFKTGGRVAKDRPRDGVFGTGLKCRQHHRLRLCEADGRPSTCVSCGLSRWIAVWLYDVQCRRWSALCVRRQIELGGPSYCLWMDCLG